MKTRSWPTWPANLLQALHQEEPCPARRTPILSVPCPARLIGPEFRFLRKEIGLMAKDLAQCLGVTDVSLSRWETGASPITPSADRLLRALYSLKTMQAGRAVEPERFIAAFLDDLKRIAIVRAPRPLGMTIPADRMAAV